MMKERKKERKLRRKEGMEEGRNEDTKLTGGHKVQQL